MTDEINLEIIKLIIQNWNAIKNIPRETWGKIRKMFQQGNKSLGFIRRPQAFLFYIDVSHTSFINKYAKYILPTEYKGYLLESIVIRKLYQDGKKETADKKRGELLRTNPRANRIFNLYSTDMFNVVFATIDKLITEGRNKEEITGISSQILDDLINDKSIIYVNNWRSFEELCYPVKKQLGAKGYCIMYGSGSDNVKKIKKIYSMIVDDAEFQNFQASHHKHEVAGIPYFSLIIIKRDIMRGLEGKTSD